MYTISSSTLKLSVHHQSPLETTYLSCTMGNFESKRYIQKNKKSVNFRIYFCTTVVTLRFSKIVRVLKYLQALYQKGTTGCGYQKVGDSEHLFKNSKKLPTILEAPTTSTHKLPKCTYLSFDQISFNGVMTLHHVRSFEPI